MSETTGISNETLTKALTAFGDALFDFSIGVGRAVDILRPELAPEVASDLSPLVSEPKIHYPRCRPEGCEVCR